MSSLWYVWLILGALFILAEAFTSGFVLLWFGIGALIAALLAILGIGGLVTQVVVFLLVSVLLTIASRTIFERLFMRTSPGKDLRTGIESLPGQVGVVVESSAGGLGDGAVKVFGSVWRAFPSEGEDPLQVGEQVKVERVDGVSVYVRKVRRDASWRLMGEVSE
jgi:membrane protein implicated in regulation of membrane protease activity